VRRRHPLIKGVRHGAALQWFVYLEGHDSRGRGGDGVSRDNEDKYWAVNIGGQQTTTIGCGLKKRSSTLMASPGSSNNDTARTTRARIGADAGGQGSKRRPLSITKRARKELRFA
jgi:hypothetical protein